MPTTKRAPAKKPATRSKTVRRRPAAKSSPVAHPPKTASTVTAPRPVRTTKRTYIFAVGRRKQAIARVRWHIQGALGITVNERELANYFPVLEQQQLVTAPLHLTHLTEQGGFTAKVAGGGMQGQAEAVRLGIARVLVKNDPDLRIPLKRAGFLRRDPRVKERKKYGLKRARRAPQWQKR